MVLSGEATVSQNKETGQMVIALPAKMAVDSQFDFKAGDRVLITYLPKAGSNKTPVLVIHKLRKNQRRSRRQ